MNFWRASRFAKTSVVGLVVMLALAALCVLPAAALGAQVLMFQQKAPMPRPLSGFGAVYYSGKIYILGGVDASGVQQSEIDVYDPSANTWQTNVGSLDVPRSAGAYDVDTLHGVAYWVGGLANGTQPANVSNAVLRIDLTQPSPVVTQVGSINSARYGARGRLIGSTFYIVGGRDGSNTPLDSVEGFDVSGNIALGTVASFPTGARFYTGTFLVNPAHSPGELGMAGGRPTPSTLTDECWQLTPGQNTPYNMTALGSLPYPRYTQQFVLLGNGVQYDSTGAQGDVFSYSPLQSPKFQIAGSYPLPHRPQVVNVQYGDTGLFVMGGADGSATYADNCLGMIANVNSIGVNNVPNNGGSVTIAAGSDSVVCVFPSGSTVGQVMAANMGNTPPGSIPPAFSGQSVNGAQIWDVSSSSAFSGPVTITLPYTATSAPVVQHWNGSSWQAVTITSWILGRSVTFDATSLSPFAVGSSVAVTSTPASSQWGIGALLLCAFMMVGLASRQVARAGSAER
jgi:hypothetical protein